MFGKLTAIVATCLLATCVTTARAEPPTALGELTGNVIWVDFWASWCAPCRRSFPWLNAMQKKYAADGLQIVGVNVDKERDLAIEFLHATPADFAISYDPAGDLATIFDVQAMPSSFLIDRSGRVLSRHYGFKLAETAEYEQTIEAALAEVSNSN